MGALTYTPILAHFGHWYVSVPTFLTPVAVIAIAVKVSERRALRRARAGDTSRQSVVVDAHDTGTTLTVQGAADYVTLTEIEHELSLAAGRDLPVLLDLRAARATEDEFAWGIVEAVKVIEDADIVVLPGSSPEQRGLREICELEGLNVRDATQAPPRPLDRGVPPG